jgi:hypothetical protein
MREIKFRAWGKNMHQFITDEKGNRNFTIKEIGNLEDLSVWELMQYTGLKDKNGVEIYEGDILHLELDDINASVKFERGMFCLSIFSDTPLNEFNYGNEVIGNIYSNPELLTK